MKQQHAYATGYTIPMGIYLNKAKKMHQTAVAELEQWEHAKDVVILQEAAEKAWGAMTQASNELIQAFGKKVPHGTNVRRRTLEALEDEHRQLASLKLSHTFGFAEYVLHNDCFYEGDCTPDEVTRWIRTEAKRYLEDVEAQTVRPRR